MKIKHTLLALSMLLPTASGFTLNGIYDIGFGVFSKGVGGAAVAFPQDTLTALSNPANLVSVGNRIDLDVEYIRGTFTGRVKDNVYPFASFSNYPNLATFNDGKYELNRNKNMMGGEAGIAVTFLDNRFSIGLIAAPQTGGVITWNHNDFSYPQGTQPPHVNLLYASFTPTFAGEILDNEYVGKHYVGIGVDFTPARLKVNGLALQYFNTFINGTKYPNQTSGNGYDWAFGWATRVGWLGEIREWISLGLSYRTKTFMGSFKKYRGLISPHGRADLPATLLGGFALKPFLQTTIAFDFGKIFYGGVKAFHNPPFSLANNNPRGAKDGAGLGFNSIWVYKVGIAQKITESFVARVGYNYGETPQETSTIGVAQQIFFLPATVRHHFTCGASYSSNIQILSAAFIWGLKHSLSGLMTPESGGGKATVTTNLYVLEVGISKKW